jgi:hypothetical protein
MAAGGTNVNVFPKDQSPRRPVSTDCAGGAFLTRTIAYNQT